MDPDLKKDILDVRNVIERSTSKVSLRDLEKKGFRKVKVLRAGDINQLIYKAVQTVLAKQGAGMGTAEREQILAEAKAEYENQQRQMQTLQEGQDRLETEKAEVEAKSLQIEEARKRLETKVGELNAQLVAERNKMQAEKAAFLEEKRQLDREKQNLFEKGLDAVKSSQGQAQALQQKLTDAQARLEEAQLKLAQAVSPEQFNQLHVEARERVQGLNAKVEELERALKNAKHESTMGNESSAARLRGTQQALEEAEARVRELTTRLNELESEVGRLRGKANAYDEATGRASKLASRTGELEAELERFRGETERARAEAERFRAEAEAARSEPKADTAETERLRGELDAARAQMAASSTQTAEMLKAIMTAVESRPAAAAAATTAPGDLEKYMKSLQQSLSDQIRKAAGSGGMRGGSEDSSSLDIGALLARQAEGVQLESNIKDVNVKQQSAQGVKDKLSKLRNMRSGGNK